MNCIHLSERAKRTAAEKLDVEWDCPCPACTHCGVRVCKCACCAKCPTCRARVCVCWGVFQKIGRIDLRARFGDVYQIDESRKYGAPAIACRYGVLYALGHGRLAVYVGEHGRVAGALSRIPGVVNCRKYTVPDDTGECEKTFQFHMDQFDAVARVVKPLRRRTRQLTPEQKAALVAQTAHARFKGRLSSSANIAEPLLN
jgi:hypothetical protein